MTRPALAYAPGKIQRTPLSQAFGQRLAGRRPRWASRRSYLMRGPRTRVGTDGFRGRKRWSETDQEAYEKARQAAEDQHDVFVQAAREQLQRAADGSAVADQM